VSGRRTRRPGQQRRHQSRLLDVRSLSDVDTTLSPARHRHVDEASPGHGATTRLDNVEHLVAWTTLCIAVTASRLVPRPRRPLSYDVVEESPAGTVVTNRLLDDSGLTSRYTANVLASLRFTVLPGGAGVSRRQSADDRHDYLSVEPRSGRLRLSATIDRDVICRQRVTCFLTFGIAVHPAQ